MSYRHIDINLLPPEFAKERSRRRRVFGVIMVAVVFVAAAARPALGSSPLGLVGQVLWAPVRYVGGRVADLAEAVRDVFGEYRPSFIL